MDQRRSSTPTLPHSGSTKQIRSEKIRVILRVRPSIPEDLRLDSVDEWCVQILDIDNKDHKGFAPPEWYNTERVKVPYTPFVRLRRTTHERRDFRFDAVLPHYTSQEDAYEIVARQRINEVLNGINASIIMYGQTGSGKSYTSFGPPDDPLLTGISRSGQVLTSHSGLVPRAISEIFTKLNDSGVPYNATLSYVQIYKDQVFDLLSSLDSNINTNHLLLPLQIREDKGGIFLSNVTHLPVYQAANVFSAIMFAAKRRAVAATQMNSNSSRSHVLLTLTIERRFSTTTKRGVLTFVDLAGSERVSKTMSDGERLSEAKKINQSLSALGNCVVALSTNRSFVPFRDSPLTRLLTESLSGNSKTLIVATIGPSSSNYDESYSTLQFATRCMSLRTNSITNSTPRLTHKPTQGIVYDSSITMTTLGDFAVMEDDDDEKITCLTSQCPRCGVHLTILPRNAVENFANAMSEQEEPICDSNDDASSCYSELSANRITAAEELPKELQTSVHVNGSVSPRKHAALVDNYKKLVASLQGTIWVLERENRAQKEALYCIQEAIKKGMQNTLLKRMAADAISVATDGAVTPSVPFVEAEDNLDSEFNSFHAPEANNNLEHTQLHSSYTDELSADQMETRSAAPEFPLHPLYDSDLYDSCNKTDPVEIQLPTLSNPLYNIKDTSARIADDTMASMDKDKKGESQLAGNVLSSYLDEELPTAITANSLLLSAGLQVDKPQSQTDVVLTNSGADRVGSKSALLISNEYVCTDALESTQRTCKLLSPSSRAPLPVIIPKFRSMNASRSITVSQGKPSEKVPLLEPPLGSF